MKVVIDTNIIFSGLLSPEGTISDLIINSQQVFEFFAPTFLLEELERHEPKLLKISGYTTEELAFLKRILFRKVEWVDLESIKQFNIEKAQELTKGIDEFDTPFVALALELNSILWTGDRKLMSGLQDKGIDWIWSTSEVAEARGKDWLPTTEQVTVQPTEQA